MKWRDVCHTEKDGEIRLSGRFDASEEKLFVILEPLISLIPLVRRRGSGMLVRAAAAQQHFTTSCSQRRR